MRINTRTGSLDLTKREQQTLADCKALLLQIAKHGDGAVSDMAEGAADEVSNVQAALAGSVLVAPDGEVINPPY
jgi:hypothetical protein